jgi:hypothetical protein
MVHRVAQLLHGHAEDAAPERDFHSAGEIDVFALIAGGEVGHAVLLVDMVQSAVRKREFRRG